MSCNALTRPDWYAYSGIFTRRGMVRLFRYLYRTWVRTLTPVSLQDLGTYVYFGIFIRHGLVRLFRYLYKTWLCTLIPVSIQDLLEAFIPVSLQHLVSYAYSSILTRPAWSAYSGIFKRPGLVRLFRYLYKTCVSTIIPECLQHLLGAFIPVSLQDLVW